MTLQAFFVTNNICYQFFIVEAEFFFFHSLNSLSIFEVGRKKKEGGRGGGNENVGGKKQSGLSNKRKIILLI